MTRALITGASSGIGKALAELLASKNIDLLISGRNQSELQALAEKLRPLASIEICVGDLKLREERQRVIEWMQKRPFDLVVNNAGFAFYGEAIDFPTQDQLDILEVNGAAVLEITIEAAKAMRSKKINGTILNISSATAFFPFPTFSVYAATKAFVKQFSVALDEELSPHGIRVLTACPGQIATQFRKRASKGFSQKKNAHALSSEHAAKILYRQIIKGHQLCVFPFRYYLSIFFSHLFPRKWVQKFLKKSLSSRYAKS